MMSASLDHEAEWWGSCANTWSEEWKQVAYASRMGIDITNDRGHYPAYDLGGRSVLDLGGGPTSMLLKAKDPGHMMVVDPCPYPDWVAMRYESAGVDYYVEAAEAVEDIDVGYYDECWIYNVLQHVSDPSQVVGVARQRAKVLRIFEWVEIPGDEMHPHVLTQADLEEWCGGAGRTEYGINAEWGETNLATAWFGVFGGS